eukprot:3613320-Rhodomonas_salina.1
MRMRACTAAPPAQRSHSGRIRQLSGLRPSTGARMHQSFAPRQRHTFTRSHSRAPGSLSPYAAPLRCPLPIVLSACYAKSGTDAGSATTRLSCIRWPLSSRSPLLPGQSSKDLLVSS